MDVVGDVGSGFMVFKLLTADIIIISLILLSAGASFLHTITSKSDNNQVTISFNNQVFGVEDLRHSNTIELDTLAVVEILENRARISFSTCRNQHCVNQGWSNSLPVVCVPNRVMLEFNGNRSRRRNEVFITY